MKHLTPFARRIVLTSVQGSYQLETILESALDKAFDKFTAWTLRNAFDVPPDLDVVMVGSILHDALQNTY